MCGHYFQRLFSAMAQAPDFSLCVAIESIPAGFDAANHWSCGQGSSLDEGKLSLASNEPLRLTGLHTTRSQFAAGDSQKRQKRAGQ